MNINKLGRIVSFFVFSGLTIASSHTTTVYATAQQDSAETVRFIENVVESIRLFLLSEANPIHVQKVRSAIRSFSPNGPIGRMFFEKFKSAWNTFEFTLLHVHRTNTSQAKKQIEAAFAKLQVEMLQIDTDMKTLSGVQPISLAITQAIKKLAQTEKNMNAVKRYRLLKKVMHMNCE